MVAYLLQLVAWTAVMAALILWPAGTLAYPGAWLLIGLFAVGRLARDRAVIGGIRQVGYVLLGDLQGGGNRLLTCRRGTVASKDNIAQPCVRLMKNELATRATAEKSDELAMPQVDHATFLPSGKQRRLARVA